MLEWDGVRVIFSTLLLNFWMTPGVIPCQICPTMFIPKSGCGLKTWHLREFLQFEVSTASEKVCLQYGLFSLSSYSFLQLLVIILHGGVLGGCRVTPGVLTCGLTLGDD